MSQALTMVGVGARIAAVASFGAMEMAELLTRWRRSASSRAHARRGHDGERVPAALALQWLADAARTLDDPLIGLNAAAQGRPRGALVHLIMSAASLRDALGYVGRFSRLLIDALDIRLENGAGECALVFAFDDPALAASSQLVDYCRRVGEASSR
ncbi:MAG: AraC family transcriptional regulator ligand-binding domain-containing protein [Proteobacteria bacterium]|nr:AraC family transcriptional regulator ligand-binding domain-containing protein [Pseudomonadota bacterium]